MNRYVLTILAMLAVACAAQADIYRWVDAQGRVHYSDRPSPGAVRVTGVVSNATDEEVVAERAQAERERRQQAEAATLEQQTTQTAAAAVEKDMAKLREERCKKAREEYRIATESQRLYRVGKDGERVYLSDAEITEARIKARKKLDEACGKQGG